MRHLIPVLTFALGLGAGLLLAPAPQPAVQAPPKARAPLAELAPTPSAPAPKAEPSKALSLPEVQTLLKERARLAAERKRLQGLLQEATDERADLAAEVEAQRVAAGPIQPPPGLADRFGEETVTARFREAYAETGLQGKILKVDCAEFPCMVYGRIQLGPVADQQRLRALVGQVQEGYAKDDFWVSQTTFEGEEGNYQEYMATFYPKDLEGGLAKAMQKRMRDRRDAYNTARQDKARAERP